MMMALGYFVFSKNSAAYQTQEQQIVWRHPVNNRIGARPATQFVGIGDELQTLSGLLYPEINGQQTELDTIIAMADTGKSYPLIDGTGNVLGHFIIERIRTTGTEHHYDGLARKIDFSIELRRVDPTLGGG